MTACIISPSRTGRPSRTSVSHDVSPVLLDVFHDPLLEVRGHAEVTEQEELCPVGVVHPGGQGLDTVLLQLSHLILVCRYQELLSNAGVPHKSSIAVEDHLPAVCRTYVRDPEVGLPTVLTVNDSLQHLSE
jgi:hypothetical protein